MDMKKYLAALQAKEATRQANFGNDADTVLGMLCSTYYELNCNQDTDEIRRAFDELYQAMTGKILKEKDEVIYATCRLCSLHQQTGFIDSLRLGIKFAQEANIT